MTTTTTLTTTWIAFANRKRIALGEPRDVAALVKGFVDGHLEVPVVILDAASSRSVEIDLRGSVATVLRRLSAASDPVPPSPEASPVEAPRGPGRPRLGVVAREVTLLPRHWDWLGSQSGGASVALRKLVERAQRASAESDRQREATESAYRFMHALAGDEAGFEEASRALFAGDQAQLKNEIAKWPRDMRVHLLELADRIATAVPVDTRPAAA